MVFSIVNTYPKIKHIMEGYTGENSSAETKENGKDKKVSKAAGLGGRTFEFAKKTDAAEKIADTTSIWEKLIPKERPDKSTVDTKSPEPNTNRPVSAAESSVESADDKAVETLSESEKAVVAKDYAQQKVAELEAGRSDTEDPAEAAAREANIEYLHSVGQDAPEVTPENTEATLDATPAEESPEEQAEAGEPEPANEPEGPAEFAHDEAVELNPSFEAEDTDTQEPVAPASASAGGGSGRPPVSASPVATPPTGPRPAGPTTNAHFNSAPVVGASPNTQPLTIENSVYQSNEGAYFLAGGILGYLLGRRRGRIKTEKRLKAVSKKLEQQIHETREQVKRQEATIRESARRRYNETHDPRGAETTAAHTIANAPRAETITDRMRQETRQPTPEQTAAGERVQHMQHHEVLAMAEKISIDGTSLRKIYESKQITEPGLRRLTREYLRGGDLKAVLQQEIKIKEMQFERDPQMRDRLAASYASVDAASPQASKEAMAALLANGPPPSSAQQHQKAQQGKEEPEPETPANRGKQVLIGAWTVLVIFLVIAVVVLATR